ncbi:ADP-ribosylation factor-like protein 6-interacting protein 4 isoform X2 [Spea bombifrons]|uniref:ADP-ribosylation factor-like protein 6-interacting protein 4 isoform X2 n=1 Tax=Spea bombifrons TaxID=233779 RepID=UPI00234A0038|nr:ADP-ribosylation factor-like protein 6-interacting protein 4 isoform X2 [Spea bombifrons]
MCLFRNQRHGRIKQLYIRTLRCSNIRALQGFTSCSCRLYGEEAVMENSPTKRCRSRSSSTSRSKSFKKKKKSRSRCSSPSPIRKPSSLAKYHSQSPERKRRKRKMRKRKASTSSSSSFSSSSSSSSTSSSSSSGSSSDDSSDSDKKYKQKSRPKKKAKSNKGKKKKKVKKKSKKVKKKDVASTQDIKPKSQECFLGPSTDLWQKDSVEDCGPVLTDEQKTRIQAMKPMTKEEWDARQSVIRRVMDPETGRMRLIKGDGEVLEEIVSKERHKEINKQATQNDGLAFQIRSGMF